MNISSVYLLWA